MMVLSANHSFGCSCAEVAFIELGKCVEGKVGNALKGRLEMR